MARSPAPVRRRSAWPTALRIVIASTVCTLVAVELALQFLTGNLGMPRYDIHPPDGRCVGLRPATAVEYTGWFLRVPKIVHDVNRLGYRGEPRERGRPLGTLRILMIGDSYAYGQAVAADQTMAANLERQLRQELARPVEVLNFGVPGLNLEENVEQYVRFASKWQHDVVLLAMSDNDLGPPICDLVTKEFTAWIIKKIRLARVFYFLVLHPFGESDPRTGTPQARLRGGMTAVAETSRAAGARAGLVLVHGKVDGAPTDLIQTVAADQSMPMLFLPGAEAGDAEIPKIPGEFHFSPEGNRKAATLIDAWLTRSGLLAGK